MKSLFETQGVDDVMTRIDKLQPGTQRQWGKMDVAQMMAHCGTTMDMARGQLNLPRIFIGRLLGPLVRPQFTNDRPFSRNGPTDKKLKITEPKDFSQEKEHLKERIQQFHLGGEGKCTTHPHPFFGPLTASEWGIGMYKHLDHHLRQFGV
jgi:hypothetical protein